MTEQQARLEGLCNACMNDVTGSCMLRECIKQPMVYTPMKPEGERINIEPAPPVPITVTPVVPTQSIRIKITKMGGYVIGDGPCPFDPDTFLILFGNKVIDAQRRGLEELEIPGEVIDTMLAAEKMKFRNMVMDAPVREVVYGGNMPALLE